MSDIDSTIDPQEAADRAWNRAREFTFRGKPLQVWDYLRKTAAKELGLKWGIVPEQDFIRLSKSVSTYRGIERDATIVLWLLHQDGPTCRAARAKPQDAQEQIDAWAEDMRLLDDALNIDPEALALFMSLMLDEQAATGIPQVQEEGGSKKNTKPAGSRKRRIG